MNILVVTQYFWPENFRVNDLVEDFIARGHAVTVLTGQPNYPVGSFFDGYGWCGPREETYKGARILRVPMVARGRRRPLRMLANYLSFAFAACAAVWFRLPRAEKFDAIFVFQVSPITVGIPAAAARHKFKAPVFFWVLDLWPQTLSAVGVVRHTLLLRVVEALVRWVYRRCDRILVASRTFIPEVMRYGPQEKAIHYFPNWGEPIFDQPLSQPETRLNPSSGTRFLYAGNIGDAQDFPTLLNALEQLKDRADIHWTIVGDGCKAPWLAKEVARRGLGRTVTLIGQQPLESMPGYFAAADVLFLSLRPDPVFERTVPGKLQSYLASGRPVLAMLDGEGAKVLEESGAGMVVPAGNAAALMRAIESFAVLPKSQLAQMQTHARAYYEQHFARERVLSQLEAWMKEPT